MDDLVKSLRGLARGKHDDVSVAAEAADEIDDLRDVIADLLGVLIWLASIAPAGSISDASRKIIKKANKASGGMCLSQDPEAMCKNCMCWKMTRKLCG